MASNFYSQIFEQFFFFSLSFLLEKSATEKLLSMHRREDMTWKNKNNTYTKKIALLYGTYFKYVTAILATFREKKSSKDQELDKNLYCIPLSMN